MVLTLSTDLSRKIQYCTCTRTPQYHLYSNQVVTKFATMTVVDYDIAAVEALERQFATVAFNLFRNGRLTGSFSVQDRRVRSWCGASLTVIAIVWWLLQRRGHLEEGATMDRFLWSLNFLRTYPTTDNGASRCGRVDEGTWIKWVWYFVEEISYLENDVVSHPATASKPCHTPLTILLKPFTDIMEQPI